MQRRRAFLFLRTDQPHVVELGYALHQLAELANIAFARSLWPWAATAARQRHGEGDERRGTYSRCDIRERSGYCPDLRKFRIIAVRGDGPVLLIGLP